MNNKIFISIASFEDPTLVKTIRSALETARHPENLTFGLGIQHYEMPDLSEFNNIRFLYWDPGERPGLIRVRYLLSKLWQGEDYFLMTDSHMTFKKDWDVDLIQILEGLGPEVVLLPQTPMGDTEKFVNDQHFRFDPIKNVDLKTADNFGLFLSDYDLIINPVDNTKKDFDLIQPTTTWRSGCVFTYGWFIQAVGFDPYSHTAHEEGYMSFRTYLNGWDTYQINGDYIEHTPEEYYDANWRGKMDKRVETTPKYNEHLFTIREFTNAFIYNDYSKYAIKYPERSPRDYWAMCNQEQEYDRIRAMADRDLFNDH